ncbi:MAG TPA: AMP-binding protein, partial [Planctomycetota bacterium]|nr:AMP-binding protein [Planctomycetota bacterium]
MTLLQDAFLESAARAPERTALVIGGERIAYGEVARRARRLAATLAERGVRRGDRVVLLVPNGLAFVVGAYASLIAGAVFVPLSPFTKTAKVRYILGDAEPACLIADADLAAAWLAPAAEAPSLGAVVVAGDLREGPPAALAPKLVSLAAALEGDGPALPDPGLIDQDLAAIVYTSGSTGEPKGVMLTHLNMVSASRSIATYLGLRADDVIFCAIPLSFDYGLYQILLAFRLGATVVLEPAFAYPVKALEIMARERVTVFPGVPTMFSMLLALGSLARYDLASLRAITNTAAALSARQIRELRGLFPRARLFSMYGLTECKRVTFLPPEELDRRPTSVGRGMPNEEVWLVDESGRRLPNGATGELVIRGSNVMRGYWRKPRETAAKLRPAPIPGEMLLMSGDL